MNYIVLILQHHGTDPNYSTPYAVYPGPGPTESVELRVRSGDTITFIPIGEKPVVSMSEFERYTDTGEFVVELFGQAGFPEGARTVRILSGSIPGRYEVSIAHKTTMAGSASGTSLKTTSAGEPIQTHPPIIVDVEDGGG